jgi:large subunit ribosomal protein L22
MADEKNTEKDQAKKPAAKKPAARKPAAKKTAAKPAAKKPATKPAAKETATKGKGAAEATSKTADTKAAETSTAKKPAAKKPAAKPKAETKPKTETKAKAPAKRAAPKPKEPATRPVVNASARFVRVAPRKARMVADQVRGLPLEDALPLLRFSTRGAAQDIRKLLESAAANAETNHDLVADDLLIKDIHVDEGPTLRRYRPRALGRATRINKRTSHIAVALTPED